MANPSINRSAIMAALFKRLQAAPGFKTYSRRFRDTSEVGALEQPALFLLSSDRQDPKYDEERVPPIWALEPMVLLYARVDDPSLSPGEVIDPLTDAIDAALQWVPGDSHPAMGSPTTLGALVEHCRVAEVLVGEGGKSGQAVVQINLHVLAAGKASP